ncbi:MULTISPECIES: FliM/FliN family flagellar motor switch protein [Burkholderia]|uniref:FliM/FliN family flagellar motor switch protein n=1 Tax=Burkholderia TaxID=32008 RepID=UPI0006920FF4|nr:MULTISPECIES: FliM/FliN family flagellar motor switch protein [Burkholderia]KVG05587.1 hypothetical protein WJ24_26800 [Burkholderia vietnamiensis]MBH9642473.1 FliM/FliN family flagellar motor switch protein [Burkholderia vietnamiensis]MBR7999441.1 FliM/FliN family flagellar motor switch protein [Burkholderia vietnamiensis]MBR8009988.1 FliM/FliN family flagellar motor switch protein [Burkholderia vietnamiensis]MDN8039431.1 FliM/FliN family flagellar motor switch protein [Burkholderia vietna
MTTHTFPKQAVAAHVDLPEQHADANAEESPRPMLELLDGVKVTVDVLLGRTTMNVKDMMTLQLGGVLQLDRSIGEPVEIALNGKAIATGEIVAIDGRFGVRIVSVGTADR